MANARVGAYLASRDEPKADGRRRTTFQQQIPVFTGRWAHGGHYLVSAGHQFKRPTGSRERVCRFRRFLRRAVVNHGPTAHLAVYHRTLSTTEQTYILRPAAADLVLKSEDLAAFRSKLTKLDAAPDLERHTMISLGG